MSGVEQRSGRLQMHCSPAAGGDPLHELVGIGLAHVHRAQQSAVGYTRGTAEHARRVGGSTGDIGRCATRGRPRRRGRHHHVHRERGERKPDESADERRPLGPVVEPEHPGDHIGQHKKRHVDAADDDFPPRWLRHLDVLLQPDRRHCAEEQPPIRGGLELPEGRPAEHVGRTAAEVVEHQHEGEWQPIAQHREHFVPAADARGDQSGSDVEQQEFAVERQSVRRGSVDHHRHPDRDGCSARPRQPTLAACRVSTGSARRQGGSREDLACPPGHRTGDHA